MKYLAAYALAGLSGEAPTKSAVEKILKAAGVPVDSARMSALFAEFGDKDFDAVCAEGRAKLVGGTVCSATAAAATTTAAAEVPAAAAAAAAPVEEEEDDDMGFGLFD